jgi:hypothetical protein
MSSSGESAKGGAAARLARILALILLTLAIGVSLSSAPALARGGQSADDCPPGNKDPDCSTH